MQHPPAHPKSTAAAPVFANPLTPEDFASFGGVARSGIGESKLIRGGEVRLTKTPTIFSNLPDAPAAALDFYEVQHTTGGLQATVIERHPRSTQMFCPMDAGRWLVVVWPDGPDGSPKAFIAGPKDVVTYKPGLWHHGIVALDRPACFASMMWKSTDGIGDTEFATLNTSVVIKWDQG